MSNLREKQLFLILHCREGEQLVFFEQGYIIAGGICMKEKFFVRLFAESEAGVVQNIIHRGLREINGKLAGVIMAGHDGRRGAYLSYGC